MAPISSSSTASSSRPSLQSAASTSTESASLPRTPSSDGSSIRTTKSHRKHGSHSFHHHGPLKPIRNVLQSVPECSHLSNTELMALSRDIWAVAQGIRMSHLVDKTQFQQLALQDIASALLRVANEADLHELRNVVIVFEPVTETTFISNVWLCRQRIDSAIECYAEGVEGITAWRGKMKPWFVRVDGTKPTILHENYAGKCTNRKQLLRFAESMPTKAASEDADALPVVMLDVARDVPVSQVPKLMVFITGWLVRALNRISLTLADRVSRRLHVPADRLFRRGRQ